MSSHNIPNSHNLLPTIANFPYLERKNMRYGHEMSNWIQKADHRIFGGCSAREHSNKLEFGGNEESKKMRKTMLKQQFTEFSVTKEKGLHKGYDRVCSIHLSDICRSDNIMAQKEKKEWEVKYEETLARFEKWKESSKNLNKLVNSSMSTRTKIGLGFKEYFGEDEVFDLYRPSTMYPEPVEEEVKPLYSRSTDVEDPNSLLQFLVQVFLVGESHLVAAQSNPAGWSKRPAPVSAGRPVSAGWLNPAARPYFRPSSVYLNNMYWPALYDPMYMNKGQWGTAGDPSTDNDIGGRRGKGGIVKFGGGDGRISGKGTIRTSKLDFENVYYVEELQHFNLFSVSQICDKKNKVLFTDTDCLVLIEEFQLPDESQVVLRIPRERDLYTFSISELQPEQNVTCLVAKASLDESTRWHRRMAHVNFKTINKLAKEGLVDGLPFLPEFIALIENQLNKKVKGIRCDNGTEFKNAKLIELCGEKGIKRDYSNPRTPQQNGVAERKNRTLIEAARTMLADSKLPTMFWTEAVSTACYVLNRVSITNPHNKTPYELISGKVPQIGHLKPFGCQVTILNTSDYLGKFEGKADEGTQETNINAGTQDHDSDSEVDEQVIVVPSFPSNSFAGPSSSNGPSVMERNADYAEELAKLQRQEYAARSSCMIWLFWILLALIFAGGVSAEGNPAVSTSVYTNFIPVHADESTLPPGQSLGSSEKQYTISSPF
ncbi:ribonuclease H-like domain-containing protein [Tanacetum coccineum]|uniref:Ribonuclease H-like domain-containing protein n=1 Tax=Tanacetum coccineum TaxID=301880 RepID=A0ABQ5CY84_9ASTR